MGWYTIAATPCPLLPLLQGGEMVCYGCMTGKAPAWPWQAWVFRELKVIKEC